MKRWQLISAVCILMFMPQCAFSAVVISEVAWMGSLDSANDEWIELHNEGTSDELLDGWTLTDGQSLTITLAGSLAAGQYAVLERTDDSSAPGSAFLIYTGALANTGATLRLLNGSGALMDQVAGGDDWESIGGDNVTKETAQLSPAGWITAAPTPGSENHAVGTPQGSASTVTARSSSGKSVLAKPAERVPRLVPSTKELTVSIASPSFIYVNQPVTFEALPSAIGDSIVDSLKYEWNFGDLATGTGKERTHTYRYPGEYIVTVRAYFARHDVEVQELIKVLPVRFSLTETGAGDVLVNNDSPYVIDISGFTLTGMRSQVFPARTYLPVNGTITIPKGSFGGTKLGQVYLRDREANTVAFLRESGTRTQFAPAPTAMTAATAPLVATRYVPPEPIGSEAFSFSTETEAIVIAPAEMASAEDDSSIETPAPVAAAVAAPRATELWPLGGLLGVIALGLLGIYFGAQKT